MTRPYQPTTPTDPQCKHCLMASQSHLMFCRIHDERPMPNRYNAPNEPDYATSSSNTYIAPNGDKVRTSSKFRYVVFVFSDYDERFVIVKRSDSIVKAQTAMHDDMTRSAEVVDRFIIDQKTGVTI